MPEESHLDRTIRWMEHDVRVCVENEAYVGAMTLMMAYITALAGYLAGRTTKRPKSDKKEFLDFVGRYFLYLKNLGIKTESFETLYDDFRNGLIHEHLMKQRTALDKGHNKPYIYFSEYGLVLNVENFYHDFVSSIRQYALDVRNDEDRLREKFIKRARFLGASGKIV